jgi:hypothetical protein
LPAVFLVLPVLLLVILPLLPNRVAALPTGMHSIAMPQCIINNDEDKNGAQASASKFFCTITGDQRTKKSVHVLRFYFYYQTSYPFNTAGKYSSSRNCLRAYKFKIIHSYPHRENYLNEKPVSLASIKSKFSMGMKYVFKHIGISEPSFYTMYENEILYSIPIDLFVKFGEKKYFVQDPVSTWYNSLSKEEKRSITLETVTDN